MGGRRWLLLAALALAALALIALDPAQYLTLPWLKARQAALVAAAEREPVLASALCFLVYAGATALSIPGAMLMTIAAGAVFGTLWGTVIVSFASTVGATLAFFMARYLLRGFVQARFGHRLAAIDRGIARDGPSYLLTLRLIPVVPFIAINLLMGLTPIPARTFYLYSQLGMLPATTVIVNAGTELGRLERLEDIVSPRLLGAFALLATLPFAAKSTAAWLRRRRVARRWPRPRRFDRNLVVIGAGSAGLVAAYLAATLRARVTLIERGPMGGDCLNTGCVPSKALLHVAKQVHRARHPGAPGIAPTTATVDFPAVMARVRDVVTRIAPNDSVARYEGLGVECLTGEARLLSPYVVEVNGRQLTTRGIVLATGAGPLVPPLPGLEDVGYLTSDTLWSLDTLPRRLLVLGGGPIGCELAQAFARLGSAVTVVEMAPRLLPREDPAVGELLQHVFAAEGIALELHVRAEGFERVEGEGRVHLRSLALGDAEPHVLAFDTLLVALGRRARIEGFGLEELGLGRGPAGTLETDRWLGTELPGVHACGDVVGPRQFTHAASHQAWYATVNALFGDFRRFALDDRVMPWCTFTDPEVARVGLSEEEARSRGLAVEVTTVDLAHNDRAVADGAERGFVKVLTPPGNDRILGVTLVGEHAGDLIAPFVLAMKHNLGLNHILGTVHIYPTLAEVNRQAAAAWRRRQVKPWQLDLLEKFHAWRRGD